MFIVKVHRVFPSGCK